MDVFRLNDMNTDYTVPVNFNGSRVNMKLGFFACNASMFKTYDDLERAIERAY